MHDTRLGKMASTTLEIARGPEAGPGPCAGAYDALAQAPDDRPFVVAQLGQSLDGRIATRTGESRWINDAAALDHLHRLRSLVDAVVVGIGTVVADDPLLNVRRVEGRSPARVVIDPRGRMPEAARCLTNDDGCRRVVIRMPGATQVSGAEVVEIETADRGMCPHAIVKALFDRGLKRLLIEGGARTVSQFIDAGAVDRLHVLVAPVILGSGKNGLDLKPIDSLCDAKRPRTRAYVLEHGEVLFDCEFKTAHGA